MNLKALRVAWNRFFFAPQSPTPLALFRILYGLLIIATLSLLHADWLNWFGPHGWVTLSTVHILEPGPRLNLFTLIPQNDAAITAFFWIFLLFAVLLTLGLFTRASSIIVFCCLASLHQRNLYINHGGDTFLRVAGFFLMFAPAGAALSLDRLIRIWRGKETSALAPRAPWAQRMIQFELAVMYFSTFCWKVQGEQWVQGTALYYVYHLDELQRFPLPSWFLRPTILKIGSWFALALEFSLGVLIWFRDLRYYLLAVGVCFHLFLEYSLNTPLFQWDILSAYILFIDPIDLTRFWITIRSRVAPHPRDPITIAYDPDAPRPRAAANLLRALDIFHRLNLSPSHAIDAPIVVTPSASRQLPATLPSVFSLLPLLYFPHPPKSHS